MRNMASSAASVLPDPVGAPSNTLWSVWYTVWNICVWTGLKCVNLRHDKQKTKNKIIQNKIAELKRKQPTAKPVMIRESRHNARRTFLQNAASSSIFTPTPIPLLIWSTPISRHTPPNFRALSSLVILQKDPFFCCNILQHIFLVFCCNILFTSKGGAVVKALASH